MAEVRTWSLVVVVSMAGGAALGALGMSEWKDRQRDRAVADAVRGEQTRVAPLKDETAKLRERLTLAGVQMDLGRVMVEVQRRNFGLARERLDKAAGVLSEVKTPASLAYARAAAQLVEQREELGREVESGAPELFGRLAKIYADLHDAL